MARRISVQIVGDSSSLERAFTRSASAATRLSLGIGTLVKSFVVIEALSKAFQGLDSALHAGVTRFAEQQTSAAQTAAALKSTGDVAGVTAGQIDDLALRLSNLSGVSRESIIASENTLLAFTNIRNAAGKNNDIFTQATKAVVDFAVRTGRDPVTAARLLGKALEDPAGKLSSLSRAGIVFTKGQIEMVKQIQKTKGVIAAQKVVIEQLTERFGGAAAAAGKTLPGELNILRDRFKDLAASIVGGFAPAFAKGVAALTGFVRRISEAKGIHAKLVIVWEGIQEAGKALIAAFERIDFKGIAETVGALLGKELRRVGAFLSGLDFAELGRTVGHAIGTALVKVSDFIGQVDFQKVGKTIIDGLAAAVVFVVEALPGILEGISSVIDRVLRSIVSVAFGAAKEIGRGILKGIGEGLRAVGGELEKIGIELVLKIIEPFTHLPGFLGGGPFQALKAELKKKLDGMVGDAQNAAAEISNALSSVTAVLPAGGSTHDTTGGRAVGTTGASPTATAVTKAIKPLPGLAAATVDKGFTLPFNLLLAQAKAAATTTTVDDLAIAKQIRAFVLKVIPSLHGQKLLGAYAELATVNQQIAAAIQAAADKVKSFTVPLSLQVAEARATALGQNAGVVDILKKIKAATLKALKSGKLGLQGQLDAWNELASVNDQIKNSTQSAKTAFSKLDIHRIVAGIDGLTGDAKKALEARLSQIGPSGTVPSGSLAAAGAPIDVRTTFVLDGRIVAVNTTRHQQKSRRRNPAQKRGPQAGR